MTRPRMLSGATVMLVSDVKRSAEYFRDALGFRFDRTWGDPPSFCMVWRDEQCFMLKQVADPSVIRPMHTVEPVVWDAYLWVDDVDALHDEFVASDATVAKPPHVTGYHVKELVVVDPDGHQICFGQELPEDATG